MQPIIIDWEKLIPPVDRADFPLPQSTEPIPESATALDVAIWKAMNYVHQRAVNGTADAFTPDYWPNREQNLQRVIVQIVDNRDSWLKEQHDLADDLDIEEQQYSVANALRSEMIRECRVQHNTFALGIHIPL